MDPRLRGDDRVHRQQGSSMQRCLTSIYEIDTSNLNFIYALIRYGKHLHIKEINSYPLPPTEQSTCQKDLQRLLTDNDHIERIKVACDTAKSTLGLFPKINIKQMLTDYADEPIKADYSVADEAAKKIITFCRQSSENTISEKIKLPTLSLLQCLLVLRQLEKLNITISGLLFTKSQIFFIQINMQNYLLQYDAHSEFYSIESMIFDFNNGFRLIDNNMDHVTIFCMIEKNLQKHFSYWKEKNYEGDLIPFEQSGFNFTLRPAQKTTMMPRSLQELSFLSRTTTPTQTAQMTARIGK